MANWRGDHGRNDASIRCTMARVPSALAISQRVPTDGARGLILREPRGPLDPGAFL
ncbi:hypothetical protein GS506_27340 [Rhodococcus hoagii]|nr:hypothetical protein [Prescottella equi]